VGSRTIDTAVYGSALVRERLMLTDCIIIYVEENNNLTFLDIAYIIVSEQPGSCMEAHVSFTACFINAHPRRIFIGSVHCSVH